MVNDPHPVTVTLLEDKLVFFGMIVNFDEPSASDMVGIVITVTLFDDFNTVFTCFDFLG
jgi:hypothetical protein